MRLAAAFLSFSSLLFAGSLRAAPRTPHELYDALNALRLDTQSAYRIKPEHHIELRRGDAKISFDEGELLFLAPLDGQVTGAAFTGRGHVLALPRDIVEKQQLGRFLGSPILDQDFASAYMRFTDATASELLQQLQSAKIAPEPDAAAPARWEAALAHLNPPQSLRIMGGTLGASPQPYFYASLDGIATGPFDLLLDPLRLEPFLLGQGRKVEAGEFYDVWASYKIAGFTPPPPGYHALQYTIDTSILPDHALEGTTTLSLRSEGTGDRLLILTLSRALNIDSITASDQRPLEYFQNQGITPQERSARGNDYLLVVLPRAIPANQEISLRFHYRGNIIDDAGNDVFFVGARDSWYPHLGDASDFAQYDLSMRWPRKLRLVATGNKVEEREDGEFRIGHWKTEKPLAIAGFNLGEYASTSVPSTNYSVDVYANRQLEQQLVQRLASESEENPHAPLHRPSLNMDRNMPLQVAPSPAEILKRLGRDIDSSIRFYEGYSGPFPFRTLSVSQIPGTFGQGWPGLLYISTYSFLSNDALRRAGLSSTGQEHFSELVPFHEVAHQWWGNVVAWSSYRDQWIDEAMASYLALLFADSRKNPEHTLHVWLQRYRQKLVEKSPSADEPAAEIGSLALGSRLNSSKSPNAYEDVIYYKGAWVMHMLREMLRQPGANPDARFNALLHTLVTKYANRALATQDLRHEIEAVMTPAMDLEGGHSMEWFFEQWVHGTGIPHYRVEFSVHKTDTGYTVRGKLFQTEVPNSFIARVPIYSAGPGNRSTLLGTVVAAGSETTFRFNTAVAPHKLQIDPQLTVLCTTE